MNSARRNLLAAALWFAVLAGCATPPAVVQPDEDDEPIATPVPSTPLIEYPPIEPVEPPVTAPEPTPSTPATVPPAVEPPPTVVPPPLTVAPPELPAEAIELFALLSDLQRYGTQSPDDVKRVRLAVLYTLAKSSPQDDQRALQLLDNVAKSGPGSPAVKQIAIVLQAQIAERQRVVKDEQQKADAAVQKLEALRAMERSLLRDRIRGGGGGGAGGSGSGSGGGGGGGGGGGR